MKSIKTKLILVFSLSVIIPMSIVSIISSFNLLGTIKPLYNGIVKRELKQILSDVSELSEISTTILQSIQEISVGNNQINSAVAEVVELSFKNKETISKIHRDVSKFKLKE